MAKLMTAIGLLLLLGGLAYHFAALKIFNALVPKDGATARVLEDVAYGPHARHRLDVYVPQGTGPFPVLVFVYGGSWDSGAKADYGFAGHAFAAQGYLTVIADYRLVPEVQYPGFVEDTVSVIRWASAQAATRGGDPDHLFVVGHSAGAYNVAMLTLDPQWLKSAGLDDRAIRGTVALAGPFDFFPFDTDATINSFGSAPDPALTQPINFVRRDTPPMLLVTGDADTRVKPRNSKALAQRLTAAGVPNTPVLLEGVTHEGIIMQFARPFSRDRRTLDTVLPFLAKVTAPASVAVHRQDR